MDQVLKAHIERLERKRASLAMLAELVHDLGDDLDTTICELRDRLGMSGQPELPMGEEGRGSRVEGSAK